MNALASTFMAHLPFLRRYARALTGSGTYGDDVLARMIEEIVAESSPPPDFNNRSRLSLYALLNRLYEAGEGGHPSSPGPLHPLEAALRDLPKAERYLFLLTSLEDLPLAQAAQVVNLPGAEAHAALDRARAAIADRLIAHVLIVEDDAIIAYDLAETVRGLGHTVIGTAATTNEAMAAARTHQPSLALLDLRLARGDSGIVTARKLRARHHLPVIFVTAFPDELRDSGLENVGPVIRKPFTRNQIEAAITKAVFTPLPGHPAMAAERPDQGPAEQE